MTQDGFPAVFCSFVLVVLSGSVVNNNNNNSSSSSSSSNNSLPYGVFQRYNEPIIQMEHK